MVDIEERLAAALRDRASAVSAPRGSAATITDRAEVHERRRRVAATLSAIAVAGAVIAGSLMARDNGRPHAVTVPGPTTMTEAPATTAASDLTTGFVVLIPPDRVFTSPRWAPQPVGEPAAATGTRTIELAGPKDQRILVVATRSTTASAIFGEATEGLRAGLVGFDRAFSSANWSEAGWHIQVLAQHEDDAGTLGSFGGPIEAVVSALSITADSIELPSPPSGWAVLVDGVRHPPVPTIGQTAGVTIDDRVSVSTAEVATGDGLIDPTQIGLRERHIIEVRGHEAVAELIYSGSNETITRLRWHETPETIATIMSSADDTIEDLIVLAQGLKTVSVDEFRNGYIAGSSSPQPVAEIAQ